MENLKAFLQTRRSTRIKQCITEKREDMSIPAKVKRKPHELSAELRNVVMLEKTEYEPDCKILKDLQFVKL